MDPNWTLLGIAIMNALTAYFAYRTHQSQKDNAETIIQLEKNTNSIKDALVERTAQASFAEGRAEGKRSGIQTAKELLEHDQARADRIAAAEKK